jgi:hypothetical protein
VSFVSSRQLAQWRRRRSRSPLALVGLTLFAALEVFSAAAPDLSGTWVFDQARSEVGPNASMAGGHLVITQKDPNLKIEMFGPDGKPSFTLSFVTDGTPTSNTLGVPQTSSARWEGETLVVAWNQTASAPAAGPPRPRRGAAAFNWAWQLGPGGNTLINEVQLNPGPNTSGEKWVFVRKGK